MDRQAELISNEVYYAGLPDADINAMAVKAAHPGVESPMQLLQEMSDCKPADADWVLTTAMPSTHRLQ